MNFLNIEIAEDYETLLVQFKALKRIAISQQAQLDHYRNRVQEFSVDRVIQLEAELESQKEMNSILTAELETKTPRAINQTAVEWLIQEWTKLDSEYYLGTIGRLTYRERREEAWERAKDMEKN
jgi:hypothetical protein